MTTEAAVSSARPRRAIVRVRRLAARLHLWGGLLTGPLVLVLGLSGMVLVFKDEIDALVQGTPARASADAPVSAEPPAALSAAAGAVSLDRIVAVALLRYPGTAVRAVRVPAHRDEPYRVDVLVGAQHVAVRVDPARLHVLGGRAEERSLLLAVHSLHAGFHAGRAGAVLVAIMGVWLVIESVSGLWLCRPWARRRVRAFGARRHGAGSRALHRVVGGVSLVLGVIVAVTGIALALASAFTSADRLTPRSLPTRGAPLDAIAMRADAALPGGALRRLIAESETTLRVEKDLGHVVVEHVGGTIVAMRAQSSSFDGWELLRRLHYGDFAGWPSRLAWALVGLALPVLALTGYLISVR